MATPDNLNGDFSADKAFGAASGGGELTATPATPKLGQRRVGQPAGWHTRREYPRKRMQSCTVSAAGVLSSGCIDPNAQALMKAYLPAPTTANGAPNSDGFNFVKDYTGSMNMNQNMAKVEWDISDSNKVTTVYNRQRQTADWVLGLWANSGSDNAVPAPSTILGGDQSDFVSTTFMHVFSPSMSSETKFNFTYLNYPETPVNETKVLRKDIPNFNLTGIFDPQTAPMVVSWNGGIPSLGAVGWAFHPNYVCYTKIPAVGEDLTKVFGTHEVKVGVYLEDVFHTQDNWAQFMGAITYDNWAPSLTGNLYADTLTGAGMEGYLEQAQPPNPVTINIQTLAFYAQDSWRATRRLTLQFGLRFDHYGKPYQPDYGMAIFQPKDYDPTRHPTSTPAWSGTVRIPRSRFQAPAAVWRSTSRVSALRLTFSAPVERSYAAATACTALTIQSRKTTTPLPRRLRWVPISGHAATTIRYVPAWKTSTRTSCRLPHSVRRGLGLA